MGILRCPSLQAVGFFANVSYLFIAKFALILFLERSTPIPMNINCFLPNETMYSTRH